MSALVFSGKRLRAARTSAGMSRMDLAAACGRTVWSVEAWERGENVPSLDAYIALMGAFGCPFDALLVALTDDDLPGKGRSSNLNRVGQDAHDRA